MIDFNRYENTTGTFTVPPGGDGFYYFSVYSLGVGAEISFFYVEHNGQRICTAVSDPSDSSTTDAELTMCSAVTYAVEGINIQIQKCVPVGCAPRLYPIVSDTPGCRPPKQTTFDAESPGCRPPPTKQTPWMQIPPGDRPIWKQTPLLEAKPPMDAESPGCRPPRRPPGCRPPWGG